MTSKPSFRPTRRAFTLVEMLMVITIIGILAGLISAAVVSARKRARVTAQKMEIHLLHSGMEAYHQKYGEYAPNDFSDRPAIERHLRRAFPKYRIHTTGIANLYDQFTADLAVYGLNTANMDAASALVFWLGGLPEAVPGANEAWAPSGFSADPTNPFQPGANRLQSFYTFQPDSTRLVRTSNGALRFYPSGVTTAPYVYFRARRDINTGRFEYGYALPFANPTYFQPYYCVCDGGANNICVPYLDWQDGDPTVAEGSNAAATPANAGSRRWRNAETFQVLSPGLDGYYGYYDSTPSTPSDSHTAFNQQNPYWYRYSRIMVNLTPGGADRDNIANFSDGSLEDEARTN